MNIFYAHIMYSGFDDKSFSYYVGHLVIYFYNKGCSRFYEFHIFADVLTICIVSKEKQLKTPYSDLGIH